VRDERRNTALRSCLETHEAGRPRCDADRRRVEVTVDTIGRVDQVQAAAGDGVAVVLDHELVGRAVAGALDGLQRDDPAVVERHDRDRGLGDHRVVGVGEWDDPDRDRRRPGGRGRQPGRADLDLEDLLGPSEQGDVAARDTGPAGGEAGGHDGERLGGVAEVVDRQRQRQRRTGIDFDLVMSEPRLYRHAEHATGSCASDPGTSASHR
jgi:hypothetical protein